MILAKIAAAALLGGWVLTTAVSGETGTEARLRVLVVTGGHGYDVEGFQRMLAADPQIEWHHRKHPEVLETITGPVGRTSTSSGL